MKIYVACFKKKPIIEKKGYHNIQLGAKQSDLNIFEYRDDTKKNISEKNPYYCELTGLYWISKNTKDKIIGLTHYRRFFYDKIFVFNKKNVISQNKVEKLLNKYDIIVPQKGYLFGSSIYEQYKKFHDIEDLKIIGEIIKKIYPDYYETFEKVIYSNKYHPYNMFIGKKELIDEYVNWLFKIFDEFEKRVDCSKKTVYNRRAPGFLGERLFNVWMLKNNLKIKEKPVYNVEESMVKQQLVAFTKLFIRWY